MSHIEEPRGEPEKAVATCLSRNDREGRSSSASEAEATHSPDPSEDSARAVAAPTFAPGANGAKPAPPTFAHSPSAAAM